MTVFIKRYPSRKEFPETAGYYDTNVGRVFYVNESFDRPKKYYPSWWLEEIELPSEEELNETTDLEKGSSMWFHSQGFTQGASFIINHIKGGEK